MARIYFRENLINAAEQLIKAKGTVDRIKAYNDIMLIDSMINSYYSEKGINLKCAMDLDERLSREYPTINKLNGTPSAYSDNQIFRSCAPAEQVVKNLIADRFGVIIDVMVKEKLTDDYTTYIERME